MLVDFAIGIPIMVVCLLLQALVVLYVVRHYSARAARRTVSSIWSSLGAISAVMVLLVIGNFAQITIWAMLFWLLGEFEAPSTAIYHSAVNFATLGYGDVVMSESHRFLGPFEAINGALMIGLSTAALTSVFQQEARRSSQDHQG